MGNNCDCGHCDEIHPPAGGEKTPEDKIAELEKEIENLGYKVEKTHKGDIKILEK